MSRINTSVFDTETNQDVNTSMKDHQAIRYRQAVKDNYRGDFFAMQPTKIDNDWEVPKALGRAVIGFGQTLKDFGTREFKRTSAAAEQKTTAELKLGEQLKAGSISKQEYDDEISKVSNLFSITRDEEGITLDEPFKVDYTEVNKQMLAIGESNQRFMTGLGIERTGEEGFAIDIVEGVGSLFTSIGISALFKNPKAAGLAFGMSASETAAKELTGLGIDDAKARRFSLVAGTVEASLEYVGLQSFLKGIKGNKVISRIINGMKVESIQEASQSVGYDLTLQMAGKEKEVIDIVSDAGYSAVIGSLVGGGSSALLGVNKEDVTDLAEKLKRIGLKDGEAKALANTTLQKFEANQEVVDEVSNMLKRQNSNLSYKGSNIKTAQDYFKEVAEDPEQIKAVFDIRESVTKKALEAGSTQEEATILASSAQALGAIAFNEGLITPQEFETVTPEIIRVDDKIDGKKGAFRTSGNVIELLNKADKTTLLHEGSHHFMNQLISLNKLYQGKNEGQDLGIYKEMSKLVGQPEAGGFTVEQNELFARGFEQFIRTGEVDNPKLKNVFQRLAEWFRAVYKSASDLKVNLSKQANEFYNDILSSPFVNEDVFFQESLAAVKDIVQKVKQGIDITQDEINKLKNIKEFIKSSKKAMPKLKDLPDDFLTFVRKRGGYSIEKMKGFDIQEFAGLKDTVGFRGVLKKKSTRNETDLIEDYAEFMGIDSYGETAQDDAELQDKALALLEESAEGKVYPPSDENAFAREQVIDEIAQIEKEIDIDVAGLGDTIKRADRFLKRNQKEAKKFAKAVYTLDNKNLPKYIFDAVELINTSDMSTKQKNYFVRQLSEVKDQLEMSYLIRDIEFSMYQANSKAIKDDLNNVINGYLKESQPVKQGQRLKGKYDYGTNKVFDKLREYNNFTQEQAQEELEVLTGLDTDIELSPVDDILNKFLSYKARGKKGDVELFKQVAEDLRYLTETGKKAKDQAEFDYIVEQKDRVDEALFAMTKTKGDKDSVKTKASNANLSSTGNWEAYINAIGGKDFMEKNTLLNVEKKEFTAINESTDEVLENARQIFGLKDKNQLLQLMQDMGRETGTILKEKEGIKVYNKETGKLELQTSGVEYDLSKMMMLDIFNAIKNEDIRNDYYRVYGKEQIDSVLQGLSDSEKLFANELMQTLKNYYSKINEVFIKMYNRDLPRVKNYWTSTAENQSIEDVFNTFIPEQKIPSFTKQRARTRIPIPTNSFNKVMKYIVKAEYMDKVAIDYRNLQRTFKDRAVKTSIEKKRGKGFYNSLLKRLSDSSIQQLERDLDSTTKWFDKLLGNWITSKIGLNPDVFFKQLISSVNYAEQMPSSEWVKGLVGGLANPKETFDFVWKNSPYLRARFNQGYSEALQYVMNGVNQMPTAKTKLDKFKHFLTFVTRTGDMTAIVYGGYPLIKYYQKQGMSLEEAIEKFEVITLRSQQSPLKSSLSSWQNKKDPVRRMLFSFSNTPSQYARKLYQATMDYQNGDISATQLAKVYVIYAGINGAIYSLEAAIFSAIVFGEPIEEDDIKQAVLQVGLTPFGGLPLIKDAINAMGRASMGLRVWDQKVPVLSDLNGMAQDLSTGDFLEVLKIGGELGTGAPIKKYERYYDKAIANY